MEQSDKKKKSSCHDSSIVLIAQKSNEQSPTKSKKWQKLTKDQEKKGIKI